MKKGKIVSSDLTRQKIQNALNNRSHNIQGSDAMSANELHELRKNLKPNRHDPKKIVTKLSRPKYSNLRRPTTQYLTNVKHNVVRLNLPERGSFNPSILDIGDKYLFVYRPDEIELIACFLNYDYTIIPDSFYKFDMKYVADARLVITPDNKVLMSYSKYSISFCDETIQGNIIMDLNESKDKIFLGETIFISPKNIKGRQKNWMPFVHDENLYFIARVCPHEIYNVDWTGNRESFLEHTVEWKNNWFIKASLRGNTNVVLLEDGNFLSTFHTAMHKESCVFYDNGCYIFEGKPPFKPLYSGHRTYLRAEAARESYYRKAGLIVCTFPCGMIRNDKKIIISYGDNDSCCKIMETNIDEMMATMTKVGY